MVVTLRIPGHAVAQNRPNGESAGPDRASARTPGSRICTIRRTCPSPQPSPRKRGEGAGPEAGRQFDPSPRLRGEGGPRRAEFDPLSPLAARVGETRAIKFDPLSPLAGRARVRGNGNLVRPSWVQRFFDHRS